MSGKDRYHFVGDASAGLGDPDSYRREQAEKLKAAQERNGRPLVGGWTDGAEEPRTIIPDSNKEQES